MKPSARWGADDNLRTMLVAFGAFLPPRAGASLRTLGVLRSLQAIGDCGVMSVSSGAGEQFTSLLHTENPRFGLVARIDTLDRSVGVILGCTGKAPVHVLTSRNAARRDSRAMDVLRHFRGTLVTDMGAASGIVPLPQLHRTVLNLCDSDIEYWESVVGMSGMLRSAAGRLQWMAARRWYPRVYESVARVVLPTSEDADLVLSHAPKARVEVIPSYAGELLAEIGGAWDPAVVFHGGDAHRNVRSLSWIINELMPALRQERPDIRLVVAGGVVAGAKRAEPALMKLLSPQDEVVADFGDLGSLVRPGFVAVEPVEHAAGSKLKVAQAALVGMPTVALAAGWRGLEPLRLAAPDLCANGRSEIRKLVLPLLDDRARYSEMSNALRDAATDYLGIAQLDAKWADLLCEVEDEREHARRV